MLKFLLIISLLTYIFFRLGGFLVKMFIGSTQHGRDQGNFSGKRPGNQSSRQRKPKDGNVSIDYIPEDKKKKKSSKNFEGGEYIDYEEVE